MRSVTHQYELPPFVHPLFQPLRLNTNPLHEIPRHLQQRPDPRIPPSEHLPQLLYIHRPWPVKHLLIRPHRPVHHDVQRAVHQVAQRLAARAKPGVDVRRLDQLADQRVLARLRGVNDDAVGEPADGSWRGRAPKERFAADGVFAVGADEEVPLEGFPAREDDFGGGEGGVFRGDFHAEVDVAAQGGGFGGEGAPQVGAVDDEVRHAVGVPHVGVEGESG